VKAIAKITLKMRTLHFTFLFAVMCLSLYDVNRIENIRLNKKLKGN